MVDAELQKTTQAIALRVIHVCEAMPGEWHARALARNLLRSGTSIGAHYRAAARGRTPATIIERLALVEDTADETLYWLDLIALAGMVPASRLRSLSIELEKIEQQVAEMIAGLRPRRAVARVKTAAAA